MNESLKSLQYPTVFPFQFLGNYFWSLTLREEHGLRVFENRMLRRIFGPKRDEVTGEWRKLHNEELNDLYSSPIIVQMIKWRGMRCAGHVACVRESRVVCSILVRKPEGEKPLGRLRHRWEDNIKMDLKAVEIEIVNKVECSVSLIML
jgi:hypothetical protein